MNGAAFILLYIILAIIAIFLIVCGFMSAIIIPNHLGLVGWDWTYLFFSLLGLFWGGAGGSLITIKNSKD